MSDFDTFTVGSKNMVYETLSREQAELARWSLENTFDILQSPDDKSWCMRWLEVLKRSSDEGFHPSMPKYGFGDATSYRLTEAVIMYTQGMCTWLFFVMTPWLLHVPV